MKNSRRILTLVIAGYSIMLLLVLFLGPMIMNTINRLQSITRNIYAHPFQVSNAALKSKSLIHEIRDSMLEAGMTTDKIKITDFQKQVIEKDNDLHENLMIVETGFLGDKSKIKEAYDLLIQWKNIREEAFHLALIGHTYEYQNLIMSKGTRIFTAIDDILNYVIGFAQNKASEYVSNAKNESTIHINTIWIMIASIVFIFGFSAVFIIRSISIDLHRGKKAVSDLEESELRFHTMFDSANDGLFILNKEGIILDVSRVGYERLGYLKKEMVGRRISDFDSPEFIDRVPARIAELMQKGFSRFESCHLHKDGKRIEVEVSARTVNIKGEPQIFSVIRDITERKTFENQLKESENRFHTLFEISKDFKVILSMDGKIVDANESYCNAMQYTKQELAGKNISELVSDNFNNGIEKRMKKIADNGAAVFESEHIRKDGSIMPVEVSTKIVELSGERYHYSILRDITDRKEIDEIKRKNREKYQAVIDTLADGFWIVNLQAEFIEVNDVYLEKSGYTREEILNMRIPDVEARETSEDTKNHIEKLLKEGHDRFESLHRKKNGEIWPVEIVTNYWPINEGVMFVFVTDISERKSIENELKLMASVFQNSGEAMLISDSKNKIQKVNPAFEELTGYTMEDVLGQDPKIVSAGRQTKPFYKEMWDRIIRLGKWQGEIWDRRKDGSEYPKWLTISTVKNDEGKIVNFIGNFSDITERKRAEAEIMELAFHDTLTGLHNRHSLITNLDHELAHARRTENKLGILFIDLDRFKAINDTLGHHVGDRLLIEVSERMRRSARESDIIARLGGDEFVVILLDVKSKSDIETVAAKIVKSVSEPYNIEKDKIYTSPSIGISIFPDDGNRADIIMQRADMAMYFSKTNGGSQWKFYDSDMNLSTTQRLSIENNLRNAIEMDELDLYFQPLLNKEGRVMGAEALVRWNHPELGILLPGRFIHVAEESNLIIGLGQWVFRRACETLKRWNESGIREIFMAVNVSAMEFSQESLVEDIDFRINQYGISHNQIELEITESTAMRNPEKILKIMNKLKDLGLRLSIDDFGTGYSSLGYLARFPIDQLKIDHSFVRDIENDSTMRAVTFATISLARQLGKQVVVEGVENTRQKELLFENGADLQQGYYYSRPVPENEFLEFLDKINSKTVL